MTENTQNRTQRSATTRENSERVQAWTPPSTLPTPDPKDGFVFRWVRLSTLNEPDARNMHARLREGWVPVTKKECPEVDLMFDESTKFKDNIVTGGLILCKAPVEMVQQRTEYYQRQTAGQMQAVDNNLMRESDSRMPIFNDRNSKVSFGRGQ